jgi:hypothetical protein
MTADEITGEGLVDAMEFAGVLDTFHRLPQEEQERFTRWVGTARDVDSHRRRINALVLALKIGPFEPRAREERDRGSEARG